MKRNLTFFTAVICLLLASALVLTGCMYSIAEDNGEIKPYDLDRQNNNSFCLTDGNVIENTPPAQAPLNEKFSEYIHKEGKTVTVFSEEQYAELKAIRDSGKRIPLTYDEILFLVNDSIGMYFSYDEIRLTNACFDNIPTLAFEMGVPQSGKAYMAYHPYHGDYSEYESYDSARLRYDRVIQEIYAIIYYRIYMHDAGFAKVIHCNQYMTSERIFGEKGSEAYQEMSGLVPTVMYQMLAIDDDTVGGLENEKKVVNEYEKVVEWEREQSADYVDTDKELPSLNSKLLATKVFNDKRQPLECKFCIYESAGETKTIYPTKELIAMKPQQVVVYRAIVEENSMQPEFGLDYVYGEATMSASIYLSFAMVGKFEEHDGVLEMHFGKSESNPDYCYVFYKNEKGYYVYSAENSNPASGSFDFADGLMFEKYRKEIAPEPNAPNDDCSGNNDVSAPHDSDISNSKNENKTLYFKLDPAGNICSLMSSDGNPYADGTYVQEGDAYILSFDGGFRYVICYYENKGYEYDKDRSNPISGYELDRGTIFFFKDGILTAKTD